MLTFVLFVTLAGVAGAQNVTSHPRDPPLVYSAASDTKHYAKPDLPKLGSARFGFEDPMFHCPLLQIEDSMQS
jgi:hypothetical protein